jgi:hypothetical protein
MTVPVGRGLTNRAYVHVVHVVGAILGSGAAQRGQYRDPAVTSSDQSLSRTIRPM